MITDAQLTLSDAQAITGDAASANQIDLTVARNLERSGAQSLRFVVLVTTAFDNLTSLTVTVRQSAATNMGSPDVIATGPAVALANLKAGAVLLDIPWPNLSGVAAKRYLDVYYDVTGTDPANGAVWAGIVMNTEGGDYRLGNRGL